MNSEFKPVLLNPSQLRAVGATLRLVEQAVHDIERLLAARAAGITYRLAEDLDAEENRGIRMACERLRETLVAASRRLGVEVAERSRRREIRGEVATLWALLEDTKSVALRGYGPLSPDAGRIVDDVLDDISAVLVGILRLAAEPRSGAALRR